MGVGGVSPAEPQKTTCKNLVYIDAKMVVQQHLGGCRPARVVGNLPMVRHVGDPEGRLCLRTTRHQQQQLDQREQHHWRIAHRVLWFGRQLEM